MRTQRHCGPKRATWWPHDEPWTRGGDQSYQWSRAGRVRFFRRIAVFGFVLLVFAVCGVLALVWLAFSKLGIIAGSPRLAVLIIVGGVVTAVVAVIGLFTALRQVGMPLRGVMEAADQVAEGNYSIRVEERGPPPIRALARSFNTMTERLGSHDRVRRDMIADIAHELRTPLAVIQGKLEGLLDGVYERDDAQLTELLAEVHVLGRLVEDLRTLALTESGTLKLEKEPTDLSELANDVARALQGQAAAGNTQLRVESPLDLPLVTIDAVRIREVLVNLVTNAVEHTPSGGTIVISLADVGNEGISVEVSDSGTGMKPEETDRVFERFHKGMGSRGLGLGLAIARHLVIAHGGDIHLTSEPGQGTKVRFSIPRDGRE